MHLYRLGGCCRLWQSSLWRICMPRNIQTSAFLRTKRESTISNKFHRTREHYNKTASAYDRYPKSIGTDFIAAMVMVYSNQKLEEIRILDAGCGPGIQTKDLIEFGFCHITLLDESSAMLEHARKRLSEEIRKNIIEGIVEESLPNIPFADNNFDVILFSLVLPHVENPPDNLAFTGIKQTLKEAHRVLRPNGMIIITTVASSCYLQEGTWYSKLIPRLNPIAAANYPSVSEWDNIFAESSFRCVSKMRLLGPEAIGSWYLDIEGPLKEEWRNSFPYFFFATEDEIKEMENKFSAMKRNGTLEQWVRDKDETNEKGLMDMLVCIAK